MIGYRAEVLASSLSPQGIEITTIEVTYPRFIHAEFLRHRVFSSSVASSRAIPTEKNIDNAMSDPFVPVTFNERVKGMGVGTPLDASKQRHSRMAWLEARNAAVEQAVKLNEIGVDKSRVNRLLEPFLWVTHIITSTEWENFFALRCPDGDEIDLAFPAQPEFQYAAILMRRAMMDTEPVELQYGEWHRPLVDINDDGDAIAQAFRYEGGAQFTELLNMLAARRVARVSFDKHTETEPVRDGIEKAGDLRDLAHFSPFEHIARPMAFRDLVDPDINSQIMIPCSQLSTDVLDVNEDGRAEYCPIYNDDIQTAWCGNLRGWVQFRKLIPHEGNHRRAMEAHS